MRLHSYFRSSATYRVRIALNLKGLSHDFAYVHLAKGEQRGGFLRVNPAGLVPVLETDAGMLTQSLAIIEYLDELAPEPPLLPQTAFGRATVRAMALSIAADIHPIDNLRVLQYLKERMGQDQAAIDHWYRHWIAVGLAPLQRMVAGYGDGAHCFEDRVSLADLCLVPQMWNARRLECDLSGFPALVAVDAALRQIDAFQTAAPENQADWPGA